MSDETLPTLVEYRGVALFAGQDKAALRNARTGIDYVLDELDDAHALLEYARDTDHPMEARLLASHKCRALVEEANKRHRTVTPIIKANMIDAATAGLGSKDWCVLEDGRYVCDLDSQILPREDA
jgi:hypothetical protein